MTLSYRETITDSALDDPYTPIISRYLRIESIQWGDKKANYLVRYQGRLYEAADQAYDKLATALRPLEVTPLFRNEAGKHTILLANSVVKPRPSNPWTNLLLFLLTVVSVLFAGTMSHYEGPLTTDLRLMGPHLAPALISGLEFSISLLLILLAHEFGHYLAARRHQTAVTLPYFLPFPYPFSPFGTLGAFIQLKEPPKNKRILMDIGIAGPLAGLVVAIPILILGLSLSELDRLPEIVSRSTAFSLEGNSILYLFSKYLVFGEWLPKPESYAGMPPLLYWIRYFFTGRPAPLGGLDVMLNPIAWAGWTGLLVTALNLIPAGQFDGGHLIYVLFGRKAQVILPFILVLLVILGLFWPGWWLWAFLIFFLGRIHAEPLDQITELDEKRKALAVLGVIVFVLVFTPIPLRLFGV